MRDRSSSESWYDAKQIEHSEQVSLGSFGIFLLLYAVAVLALWTIKVCLLIAGFAMLTHLAYTLWSYRAQRRVQHAFTMATVKTSPSPARLGEPLGVLIHLDVLTPIRLDRIVLRWHSHESEDEILCLYHRQELIITLRREFFVSEKADWNASFDIPIHANPSGKCGEREVTWFLEVLIYQNQRRKWPRLFEITVVDPLDEVLAP